MSISRRAPLATTAALVLLALGLRLHGLYGESPWGDEVLTAARYPASSLADFLEKAFTVDPTMRHAPLYHVVQYGWTCLAGDSVVALRLLSVLLSVVGLLQLGWLGRALQLGGAGAWGMLLVALCPLQIYYAQEIRVYALANVVALAAMHGCYRMAHKGALRWFVLTLVANGALIMTHSVAGLMLLPAQALYLVWRHRLGRPTLLWAVGHGMVLLVFFVWLQLLNYQVDAESFAYNDRLAGLREVAATVLQLAGGRFSTDNPGAWLPWGVNLELPLVLALMMLVGVRTAGVWRNGEEAQRHALVFLLLWLVVPLISLFIVGRYWKPFFYTRYALHCGFPLALLVGWAMSGGKRRDWRAVVLGIVVCAAAWQSLALPRPFRADYGAAARLITGGGRGVGDYVIALKPFNHRAADFALRESGVPVERLYGFKEMVGVARNRAGAGETVWALFYRWDDTERYARELSEGGFDVTAFETGGMPPLTVFRVRSAVPQPSSGI